MFLADLSAHHRNAAISGTLAAVLIACSLTTSINAQDIVLKGSGGSRAFRLCFINDGQALVVGQEHEATVTVWDWKSGVALHSGKTKHSTTSFAFSEDGEKILAAVTHAERPSPNLDVVTDIVRLDADADRMKRVMSLGAGASAFAMSPDASRIAVATFTCSRDEGRFIPDTTVVVYDLEGKIKQQEFAWPHDEFVCSIEFSPDGKLLAAGGQTRSPRGVRSADNDGALAGAAMLWSLDESGRSRDLETCSEYVECVAFSPDGKLLGALSQDEIRIYDARSGVEQMTIHAELEFLEAMAFSPDGSTVVGVGYGIDFWDLTTGEKRRSIRSKDYTNYSVAFSPSGSHLAVGGIDGCVRIWRICSKDDE